MIEMELELCKKLLFEMVDQDATEREIERVIRYSMDVIDLAKTKRNEDIEQLVKKYIKED